MRVLVTGAQGFVGRHVVKLLREHGHDVTSWALRDPEPDVIAVDLMTAAAVCAQDLTRLDAVIHLAGLAEVAGSFDRPAEYVCGNATMEINLMEALLRVRSDARVLVVSTGAVYEGGHGVVTEQSSIRATNPYVVSKLTQEQLGHYYGERGLDVIIARPFNHIGPGQQRGFLVSDAASQIACAEHEGGGKLHLGNLQTTRDFTDVRDVAMAYLKLITSGRGRETYNVCSGVSRSGREIIDALLKLTDVPLELSEDDVLRRPIETFDIRADNTKLRADTGWTPAIPLNVTLADTLDYWRTQLKPTSR